VAIHIGIGVSAQADVFIAGQEAARHMVAHLAGRRPDLTLVFSSVRFADPKLLKGIRSVTGAGQLIGCTDAGGISTSGLRQRSVTVIGLVAPQGQFITGVGRHLSQDPKAAGYALGVSLKQRAAEKPKAMLMFPDGLTSNGSEVLAGAIEGFGRHVPIVGGASGDDLFFQKTFQFFNDETLTDSVPGVLLCGEIVVGIGARHGWMPLGRPRRVTRAKGHILYQLDRRPAVSIYEDYLGLRKEELMEDSFARVTMAYPLGMAVSDSPEFLLRDAIRVGGGGSLVCTGSIAEGSEVQLMIGGYEPALDAAQQAAQEAITQVGRERLRGALVFCSVARQRMLGSEFQGEIDVIRDALGGSGVRMGGFYSYGEIAPASPPGAGQKLRRSIFHNESVVVMGLG
jgi:hypothetical protein